MGTLLLRLAGPMQSWGTQSRFTIRDTELEPSKSGVIGLLCAALGRPRSGIVDDLAALRMGVRADFEGSRRVDYQTAGGEHRRGVSYGVYKANANAPGPVQSWRYYLADADFLVGLEGEPALLAEVQAALARPVWQLFLGRKSFVPGEPVRLLDGLRQERALEDALVAYPWPRRGLPLPPVERRPDRLRVVLERDGGFGYETRRDQPVGAAFLRREYASRWVETQLRELGAEIPLREEDSVSVTPVSKS